jgi:hypothetical protein
MVSSNSACAWAVEVPAAAMAPAAKMTGTKSQRVLMSFLPSLRLARLWLRAAFD